MRVITQLPSIDQLLTFLLAATLVVSIFLLTWFWGRIFKFLISKMPRINADIKNGLFVLVSITQFMVLIIVIGTLLINLGVQQEYIFGSLAILVTALGVSFTGVAANFIGGMYILTTRPFKVGDFIRTQGIEGIVQEIGINFSRLLTIDKTIVKIPNGNLINTSLLNYTKRTENPQYAVLTGILNPSRHFVTYKKMVELRLDIVEPPISIKSVRIGLDQVCKEFSNIFGAKPEYYLGRYDFRQKLFLVIRADDGYTIFNAWPYFMEGITKAVYQVLQQENDP